MICNQFQESLELYALGVLEGEEASAISDHLSTGCPTCRESLRRALDQNLAVAHKRSTRGTSCPSSPPSQRSYITHPGQETAMGSMGARGSGLSSCSGRWRCSPNTYPPAAGVRSIRIGRPGSALGNASDHPCPWHEGSFSERPQGSRSVVRSSEVRYSLGRRPLTGRAEWLEI
jgi:hypothetical protein